MTSLELANDLLFRVALAPRPREVFELISRGRVVAAPLGALRFFFNPVMLRRLA